MDTYIYGLTCLSICMNNDNHVLVTFAAYPDLGCKARCNALDCWRNPAAMHYETAFVRWTFEQMENVC